MKQSMITRITLVALLAFVLVTQCMAATRRSFWEDEAWTAGVVTLPLAQLPTAIAHDSHPPLYFTSVALWSRIAGADEFGLRSFSILWALLIVVAIYALGAILSSPPAGLIASVLVACSPLLLTYGHTARYYSMAGALSLGVALSCALYLRTAQRRYLGLYILSSLMLIYTVYLSIGVLLGCVLWGLITWIQQGYPRRTLVDGLVAHGLIAIGFLPWVPTMLNQIGKEVPSGGAGTPLLLGIVQRISFVGFSFSVGETISPLNVVAWIGLLLTVFALGWLIVARTTTPNRWVPPLLSIVMLAVAIAITIPVKYPESAPQALPNRGFFILPFFILWVATGISLLRKNRALLVTGALVAVSFVGVGNYFTDREFLKPFLIVPWREITANIATQATPATAIVCNQADTTCAYYIRRVGLTPLAPTAATRTILQQRQVVWWLQVNMAESVYAKDVERQLFAELQATAQAELWAYAPQDLSIRQFKTTFLQQNDYAYRISVYRFTRNGPPKR